MGASLHKDPDLGTNLSSDPDLGTNLSTGTGERVQRAQCLLCCCDAGLNLTGSVGLSAGALFNGVCSSKVLAFISSRGFVIKMGHTENMINSSRNVGAALTPGDAHLEFSYKGNCFAGI